MNIYWAMTKQIFLAYLGTTEEFETYNYDRMSVASLPRLFQPSRNLR